MASRKPTLDSLITYLLQEVSSTSHEGQRLEEEWKHYMRLYEIALQIQEKEAARDSADDDPTWPNDVERRKAKLPAFVAWLAQHGLAHDKLDIVPVHTSGAATGEFDGFGVIAKAPIQKAELVFEVPEKIMITTKNARESKLEILTIKDPLLKTMDNVLLAMFLLYEKYISRDGSFWKPYIDVLPKSYDTILYFKPDEMKLLMQSASGFREAVKMFRNIARQYSYFHSVFRKGTDSGSRALKNIFTFKRYIWAVSSVITRQNVVPRPNNVPDDLSVVPFWDMINHQETAHYSTDYNMEEKTLLCYASHDYEPGEELKIFYGHRSSLEFFIHGGFVPQSHTMDSYNLELGISKNDPNFLRKKTLLEQFGLQHQLAFSVKPDRISTHRSLLVFVRIFLADKEMLDKIESEEGDYDYLGTPTEQAWKFLGTRFTLLKQSAENNLNKILKMIFEEYKVASQDEKQLSARQLMVLQLFKNEKKLLELLAICCDDYLSQLMKPTDAE